MQNILNKYNCNSNVPVLSFLSYKDVITFFNKFVI